MAELAAAYDDSGPERPSHGDLLKAIRAAERKADTASSATGAHAMALQRVEGKMDQIIKVLGAEDRDERGAAIGTGLTGRLMRLEHQVRRRFATYDNIRALATGGLAGAGVVGGGLIATLWWALGDKLGHLLK